MQTEVHDIRQEPDGRALFVPGQRLVADTFNALVGRLMRETHGLAMPCTQVSRILAAPSEPLAELAIDATGRRRLRLSGFVAVVMGELVDLTTVPEERRSLLMPEVPADEGIVSLFFEIRHRVVGIDRDNGCILEVSEANPAPMNTDLQYCSVPEPALTGGCSGPSAGALEIARIRFEDGSPRLVTDFIPTVATLASVPATRHLIEVHLKPALELSKRAARLLAERDDAPLSLRWKLGAIAGSGREIRRALADHGRALPNAYRVIVTELAETLRVIGATRTSVEDEWPEELWEKPHLLSEALVLDDFLDAADAVLAVSAEAPLERPGWTRLSASQLQVRGTPAATEFVAALDRPLGRIVGFDCCHLVVEVRAEAPFAATGPVYFHPHKSRDRVLSRFCDFSPRGFDDEHGFEFKIDLGPSLCPHLAKNALRAGLTGQERSEAETKREILESQRIRFVCPIDLAEAPNNGSERPAISARFRGVSSQ